MSERRKRASIKRRKREILINRLLLASIVLLIVSFAFFLTQRAQISKLNREYQTQVQTQEALSQRVEELKREIKKVNSLEYIEKRAREDLGMIKEGESVYIEDQDGQETDQGDQ